MVSVANKYHQELQETAAYVAAKGILAADESTGTIAKRFESIAVENTEENRRAYRELLFTSPNIGEYISGAILFEETLGQKTASGEPFVDLLKRTGIMIGIKVDKGVVPIHGTVGETATQGLDGLGARCAEYYKKGCRFAKWRAVINVSDSAPSELGIAENAHGLARYAAICQENGLVPIVEPEVLMDGPHDIERAASVTEHVLSIVFRALHEHHVLLEGILLKPNMVLPGSENPNKRNVSPQTVAEFTVRVLGRTVPPVVPGIMFLSGGQSEEEATLNLDAMNKLDAKRPWSLSFSYGRALQSSCLKAWKGQSANFEAAQQAFLVRAKANHEAHLGVYGGGAGGGSASESLHVKNYTY